jgi:hypothetical protein
MKKILKRIRNFFSWNIGLHGGGSIEEELKIKYPFKEGDDYYIIDGNNIIWSCWDEQSEELHTEDRIYFTTVKKAKAYGHSKGININTVWDYNGTYKIQ